MNGASGQLLQEKLAELLRWQRRKRWEQLFCISVSASCALAMISLPLHTLLPAIYWHWLAPLLWLCVVGPALFYRRRWRAADGRRAVVELDGKLAMDARALTAWELAARGDRSAAAQLVLHQAEARLGAVEPRRLFPRQWSWPAYAAAPLALLWFALLWFDGDRSDAFQQRAAVNSLAQKLREFAQDFQDKAKADGLRDSLRLGQELEKLARKSLAEKAGDEQLKKDLAGVRQKLEAAGKAGAPNDAIAGAESEQSLRDLKAELEAARDLFNLPDNAKAAAAQSPQFWQERLGQLPQLRKQLDLERQAGQGLGQQELQALLDRLDRQVAGALDRRALIDAQQFLDQMMQQGQAKENNNAAQLAGRGERPEPGDGQREKNHSNLPGQEAGENDQGANSLPGFRADTRSQIKGQIGAGESSGVIFKGKPLPGKSELATEAVVANYRRQAEQELNSEKVPAALKETVRKYFLSLEDGKR